MKLYSITLTFLAAAAAVACGPAKFSEKNVDKVFSELTPQEKIHLLVGGKHTEAADSTAVDMIAACDKMIPGCAGYTYPIPRLGIPPVVLADGPAGLRIAATRQGTDRTFYCTGFPIGSLLSSTWDCSLVEEVAAAIGEEVRDYGVDVLLAPGLNLQRNPLCGRNFEYYSEDPLLVGKTAAAYVRGVQSKGVGTSIKHFAANNEEVNRLRSDSRVSPRALRELYLKGFEIAVKEGKPWTVMSSYNLLNGEFAAQRHDLLEEVLRDEWGFDGLVMSDWGGGIDAVKMVAAGNDLLESGRDWQYRELSDGFANGGISPEDIDRSAKRVLRLAARSPRGRGLTYSESPDLKAHAEVARRAATEGMVLLKNDGALPLAAGSTVALFGANSYKLIAGGTGAGDVNKAYIVNLPEGLREDGIVLNPALDAEYRAFVQSEEIRLKPINEARGWWFGTLPYDEMPADRTRSLAVAAAESSDAAVVTIVRQAGEGKDRLLEDDYLLSKTEVDLIKSVSEAFRAKGKKTVVVINAGGIIDTGVIAECADGLLMAWQPGQEAGCAIADVLSGKVNPSGRLPITIPRAYSDVPSSNFPIVKVAEGKNGSYYHSEDKKKTFYDMKDIDYVDYIEDIYVGYRYYSTFGVGVAYPFGYGLSYTDFDQKIVSCKPSGKNGWKVEVRVTNKGNVPGKDVVQLYSSRTAAGNFPSVELKAFGKTGMLGPGETQTVSLAVKASDLASYDESLSAWSAPAGEYVLSIARNAAELIDSATVTLSGDFLEKTGDCFQAVGPKGKGLYIDGGNPLKNN